MTKLKTVENFVEVTISVTGDIREKVDSASPTGRTWVSGPADTPVGSVIRHKGVLMKRLEEDIAN